jgi:hypothetical protein
MVLGRSLNTPSCPTDVTSLSKPVVTCPRVCYSTLAFSRLSQKGGNRREWLIRLSQRWFTIKRKLTVD